MTTGPVTVSVLEIAIPLPFIARRSPQATQLQRRVLGVRAGPHPVLTLGAMKHTRPFIARRPGPGVAGETAPGAGANRAPALAPAVANGDPSTRSGRFLTGAARNGRPAPDRPALDQEREREQESETNLVLIRRCPRSTGDFRDSRAGMRVAGPHKLSQAQPDGPPLSGHVGRVDIQWLRRGDRAYYKRPLYRQGYEVRGLFGS